MKFKLDKILLKTWIALGGVLFALLCLLWVVTHSYVAVQVTPRNSTVSIDNKTFKTNGTGTYRTISKPGKHTVSVEAKSYTGIAKEYAFKRAVKTTIKIDLKEQSENKSLEAKGKFLYSDSDSTFYYLEGDGTELIKGYIEDNQLKTIPITDGKLSAIKEIIWSPDKNLALFRKNDGKINLFDFKKYDFINQTETLWGENIGSVAWAPDNSEIAYYSNNGNVQSLFLANVTNTEKERVYNFAGSEITNPILKWSPDSKNILLIPRNKNVVENKLYVFSTFNRTLKQLTNDGNYTNAAFTPDSDYVLASNSNGKSYRIKLGDPKQGSELAQNLNLNIISFLKKNPDTIYAASQDNTFMGYDFVNDEKTGTILKNFTDKKIDLCAVLNGGKILVYQTADGIFSINLQ